MFSKLLRVGNTYFSQISTTLTGLLFSSLALASSNTVLVDYTTAQKSICNDNERQIYTANDNGYTLNFVSQDWDKVSKEYSHYLDVVNPTIASNSNMTLLILVGGETGDSVSDDSDFELLADLISNLTGSRVAVLSSTLIQPILFDEDETESEERSEDALMAYTHNKALETNDMTWSGYVPMTQSTICAMDRLDAQFDEDNTQNDGYILIGLSKYAVPTYLAAAVEQINAINEALDDGYPAEPQSRVKAIVPVVYDALNLQVSLESHFNTLGRWADAVSDYAELDVFNKQRLISPSGYNFIETLDPFSYKEYLELPKLIVNAANDDFFNPDSSTFYADQLLGQNYLRYLPNTNHFGENQFGKNGPIFDMAFGIVGWVNNFVAGTLKDPLTWSSTYDESGAHSLDWVDGIITMPTAEDTQTA